MAVDNSISVRNLILKVLTKNKNNTKNKRFCLKFVKYEPIIIVLFKLLLLLAIILLFNNI